VQTLTVATFNIHHGAGGDGKIDLSRTAEAIARTGADVIALQELDRGLTRSGGIDQPAALAELTGMVVSFFPTVDRAGGQYGLALAAWQPVDTTFVPLPRVGSEEPRGALTTRIGELWIVATHLATQRKARALQATALAAMVDRSEGHRVVMGDLNCSRRELKPLVDAGVGPVGPHLITYKGRIRAIQIDHILVGAGIEAPEVTTVSTDASDHLPLVAELLY
jgi:endonuclease/exonuclease/phosphatase family metal-dependent hydrolase